MSALTKEVAIGCTVLLVFTMATLRIYTCEPTNPTLQVNHQNSPLSTLPPATGQNQIAVDLAGLTEHELSQVERFKAELIAARTHKHPETRSPSITNADAENPKADAATTRATQTKAPNGTQKQQQTTDVVVTTTAAVPPQNLTIMLIRSHKMTVGMMDRAIKFAQNFADSKQRNAVVWVSFDTTLVNGEADKFVKYIRSKPKSRKLLTETLFIHLYNTKMMLKEYPKLEFARKSGPHGWSNNPSAAFGFHTETITIWYKRLPQAQKQALKYLWVFEADVAYRGPNILEFMNAYDTGQQVSVHTLKGAGAKRQVDRDIAYIAEGCHDPGGWMHSASNSKEYRSNVPEAKREASVEAVQRFTKAYIEELVRVNDLGMHTWSEQAGCSFANNLGWPTGYLKKEHLGNPYTYYEAVAFKTIEIWDQFFKQKPDPTKKLYHPVKY